MKEIVSRSPDWTLPGRSLWRYVLEAAAFVPIFLALDWASYIEPLGSFNITPWSPAPALAVVWMMRAGLSKSPVVFAATFLADDIIRDLPGDYAVTLLSSLVLTAGYALMATALRALSPRGRPLTTLRSLTALVCVVAIGTAVNCTAFLGVLVGAALLSPEILGSAWLRFWIGDVVGILVTAPLLLLAADAQRRAELGKFFRRAESYLQLGLMAIILWLLLADFLPDPSDGFFLFFPPLIWIALRSGLAGALIAVSVVQAGVVTAFLQQAQPVVPIIELQVLVATLTLTGLYLGVMVDERQRAMDELNRSLHLAAAGEMAGAITHEVSQPLTALASYSQSAKRLVKEKRVDGELATLVEKIAVESLRAARVVRRLRDFFRAGTIHLQPAAVPELLELIGRIGAEATEGTAIAFAAHSDPGLPVVPLDKLQIEVVLRNLIGNAVDSLREHAQGRGQIAVGVRRDGQQALRITVADDGPGVPVEAREQLFRPFASGKPSGMGLGLAVSRAIAEAHGGSLAVGAADHGEFHLSLPLDAPHE